MPRMSYSRKMAGFTCAPVSRHYRGQRNRRAQAAGIGSALAGNIKSGTVVRRRAHDRQTNSDIDSVFPREQLERDQPLIVIEADDSVKLSSHCPDKQRIRRKWPSNHQPLGLRLPYGWSDNSFFFIAKRAAFTGVRVE